MTPQELKTKFDDAMRGPSLVKPPREIGQLSDEYRGRRFWEVRSRIGMVQEIVSQMSRAELMQLAQELRHGLRLRMVNDEVLAALFTAWAAQVQDQPASPLQSDLKALAAHQAVAAVERIRQREAERIERMLQSELSREATLATLQRVELAEAPPKSRESLAGSDK